MDCLRGLIVSPDQDLLKELGGAVARILPAMPLRKVGHYPESPELETLTHTYAPVFVILDMADPQAAVRIALTIQRHARGTQFIAVCHDTCRETVVAAMRAGMREVINLPLETEDLERALTNTVAILNEQPPAVTHTQHVVSFLPAKPGVGTSTIALHTALALSRFGNEQGALMDLDVDSGILDFMLKLPFSHGIADLAGHAPQMDENLWLRMASRVGNLDLLRSGNPPPGQRVSSLQAEHLVAFARRNYNVVCLDLPAALDAVAAAVLDQSRLIFLVTTPELASLHLARRRLDMLDELHLRDRTRLILNRTTSDQLLSAQAIEDLLNIDVYEMFPNDYSGLQSALANGRAVDFDTPLGRCFLRLARRIAGVPLAPAEPRRGLLDLLGLSGLRRLLSPRSIPVTTSALQLPQSSLGLCSITTSGSDDTRLTQISTTVPVEIAAPATTFRRSRVM
jgi:pilus assembly protein CpaE